MGIKSFMNLLTIVVSGMALSSLVVHGFGEPLLPYLKGLMGSVLDRYQLLRDLVFDYLSIAFSGIINFIANWVKFLPLAPWFSLPAWGEDMVALYFLIAANCFKMQREQQPDQNFYYALIVSIFAAPIWPIIQTIFERQWIKAFYRIPFFYFVVCWRSIIGATIFFALAYGEYRIGF